MLPFLSARMAAAALTLCSALAPAEIDAVRPAAFAPGALLRVEGRGLSLARSVRFTALGPGDELLVREQPVVAAADGALLVVAPAFGDAGDAPASPWAWLSVADAAPQPVFALEATAGRVRVAGAGSQLAGGTRLALSFDLAGGPPSAGNTGFTLTLEGAPSGVPAIVLAGAPAAGARVRLRDAALGVNLGAGFVVAGSIMTGPDGRAALRLPVPALSGVEVAAMWAVALPDGRVALSDTLVALL